MCYVNGLRLFFDFRTLRGKINVFDSLCCAIDAVRVAVELVNAFAADDALTPRQLSWARLLRGVRLLNSGPLLLFCVAGTKVRENGRALVAKARAAKMMSLDMLVIELGQCTVRKLKVQRLVEI